jgi:NDP-sugar pyrophosphorylase family protein
MKAMILAAGVGSRLKPLTDKTPKALMEIGGKTMLERAVERLRAAGVTDIIVNAHHHADQVEKAAGKLDLEVSKEDVLLDTGGGLKKAAWFFDGDKKPFLLQNVDVVSDLDLAQFYKAHKGLATLAVRKRETSRFLVFGKDGRLLPRDAQGEKLGFDGAHVISPEIFPFLTETGAFSLTQAYLRLAAAGQAIHAFRADKWSWLDIGTPEKLEKARSLS